MGVGVGCAPGATGTVCSVGFLQLPEASFTRQAKAIAHPSPLPWQGCGRFACPTSCPGNPMTPKSPRTPAPASPGILCQDLHRAGEGPSSDTNGDEALISTDPRRSRPGLYTAL